MQQGDHEDPVAMTGVVGNHFRHEFYKHMH